ncbi:MAG TPA: hypothetical protein VEC11_13000 [Allosphingosinicella sp.]|nr:hypothetical protein [Allosphingosinicella sp.]
MNPHTEDESADARAADTARLAGRPPARPFDEAADAEEQLLRLGVVRVKDEHFRVGPYRYTRLADARAEAERMRARERRP